MEEKDWKSTWKGRIAKHICKTYSDTDTVAKHFFNLTIDELLWHATTIIKVEERLINIKYIGQRYWSKEAIEHYCKLNSILSGKCKGSKGLRHEHAVPRKMIRNKIEKILEDKKSNEQEKIKKVYDVIATYSKSVIITKEEDRLIPNKDKFTKWTKITDNFAKVFKEEDFINFIKKERYKSNIQIIDLCNHLDKNDSIVPYDKKFKDIMHKIKTKNNE